MTEALEAIGPKTREKLLETFGSPEALVDAARSLELHRFAAIRGISEQGAVDLISRVLGLEEFPFLRTPAAEALYRDVVARIQGYASTRYGRHKALLLRPLRDPADREALLAHVLAAKERVRQLPRERVQALLRKLPEMRGAKAVFDSSKVVVAEDRRLLEQLRPFERYCEVLHPEDLHRPEAYELIVYAASPAAAAEVRDLEQVHLVLGRPEPWQLFPESVVDFFRANQGLLEVLRDLGPHVGGMEPAAWALEALDGIRTEPPANPEEALREVEAVLNAELKERLSRLSLEGDEVLELLGKGMPPRLREVFAEVLEEGEEEIRKRTGLRIRLEPAYPLTLPEEELARALQEARQQAKARTFEALQRGAKALLAKEEGVRHATRRALEFDFEVALGSFALDYDLQPPRWGRELRLKGALHLDLVGREDAQRVDYALGGDERVALLTGANSGGKTTLLETVAQVYILAVMGLPVSAREAVLEDQGALYFFSRQKALSAGALEGFLTTFMPLALESERKLILADELEAMTEPEAAAAIVATFLDRLKRQGSTAVVVTHAARAIRQLVDIRVDGIEARGLDEAYELVVDRTPKRGVVARSTPELILQRLRALRKGPETALYDEILRRLQAGAV